MNKNILHIIIISFIFISFIFISCNNTDSSNFSTDLENALNRKSEHKPTLTKTNYTDKEKDSDNLTQGKIAPSNSVIELQKTLRSIANHCISSVVNVRSEAKSNITNKPFGNDFFNDDFFDFFFDYKDQIPQRKQQFFGSGFIISEDGYIVTNHHVVNGAEKVVVFLSDEREFDAEIVGVDAKTDIALLKIESKERLKPVPLGNSNHIEVGDIAIAIGNPFGLNGTFTMGVISAKGRDENNIDKDASYKDYIQTDAPINQGNSGGPLLNIYGEVIGMNTAIYSTTGGSIGIGFAVPVNIIKKITKDIAETGSVKRPLLGVNISDLSDDLAKFYDVKNGAFVQSIIKGSAAEKAGIQAEDVIIKVNNKKIKNTNDLIKEVVKYSVGDTITITLLRIKKQNKIQEMTVEATLELREEDKTNNKENNIPKENKTDEKEKEWMKMTLSNIEKENNPDDIKGVIITNIEKGSYAYGKGIRSGDIIVSINGTEINSLDDLDAINDNNIYIVRLYRNGNYMSIAIKKE